MIHEKKKVPVKIYYKHMWSKRMVKDEVRRVSSAPIETFVHGETYTLHMVGRRNK